MKQVGAFFVLAFTCTFASAGILTMIGELFTSASKATAAVNAEHAATAAAAVQVGKAVEKAAATGEAEKPAQRFGKDKYEFELKSELKDPNQYPSVGKYEFDLKYSDAPVLLDRPNAAKPTDLIAYQKLQNKAGTGDTDAMLKMSMMIRTKAVIDPSLPQYDYWLVQAASRGSVSGMEQLRQICVGSQIRKNDKKFDAECQNNDLKFTHK